MKLILSLIIFSIFLNISFAEDSNQTLPGQLDDDYFEQQNPQTPAPVDENILDNLTGDEDRSKIFYPPLTSTEEYQGVKKRGLKDKSIKMDLEGYGGDSYLTFSDVDTIKEFENKGTRDFMFSFLKDTYSYDDDSNVFKKTFVDGGDESLKGGLLYFSMNKYIWRSLLVNGKVGMNFGIGYNEGIGIFAGETKSRTRIQLYTLPLELNLASEINITRFMKVLVAGGPSLLGLVQNRSDRVDGDDQKEIRQMSFGYFYTVGLKVSFSDLFPTSVGHKVLSNYDISKLNIDVYMRGHDHSGFKAEDLKISGTSYGLGFSFEFL